MDVDLGTAPVGYAKEDVELTIGIAVQRRRVNTAHHLRAFTDGCVQILGRAGAGHDACLGKATSSISIKSFHFSRACITARRLTRPVVASTST